MAKKTNLGTLHPLAKVEVWVNGACARSKRLSSSSPCSTGSSITICPLSWISGKDPSYRVYTNQFDRNFQSLVGSTSACIWNPGGGSKEGISAVGGSSPGQIHIIPSCSKHGIALIFTLSSLVDGIFSHFPSVEYSHPTTFAIKTHFLIDSSHYRTLFEVRHLSHRDKDTGYGPH